MFPNHLGRVRERFSEAENRTWELMRAFDALSRSLRCVVDEREKADRQAAELMAYHTVALVNVDAAQLDDGQVAALDTAAKELGVDVGHLWRVVKGERVSKRLCARLRAANIQLEVK